MNVSCDIARVAAPALYVLKLNNPAQPTNLTEDEWQFILDEMYYAMCSVLKQEEEIDFDRVQRGCEYLGQYFMYLFS